MVCFFMRNKGTRASGGYGLKQSSLTHMRAPIYLYSNIRLCARGI